MNASAQTIGPPVSETRSFSTIFLIEMWERFGFYGMQVLMVTYMIKKLGFVDTRSNLVWAAAAALIYAMPAVGGWIGDKLIGTRRTMPTGAVVLSIGYALLWFPTENPYTLYFALGVITLVNCFFKPNAGKFVRKIYERDETRIDSAFTLYCMAVNIGSMVSMMLDRQGFRSCAMAKDGFGSMMRKACCSGACDPIPSDQVAFRAVHLPRARTKRAMPESLAANSRV